MSDIIIVVVTELGTVQVGIFVFWFVVCFITVPGTY